MTTSGSTPAYTNPVANVLYVSPDGDDRNDGRSWGTAKQTILAAYDALPTGLWNVEQHRAYTGEAATVHPNPPAQGGTIYIASGSAVGGEVPGQGLWFIGANIPERYKQMYNTRYSPPNQPVIQAWPQLVPHTGPIPLLPGWRWAKDVRLVGAGTGTIHLGEVHAARITTHSKPEWPAGSGQRLTYGPPADPSARKIWADTQPHSRMPLIWVCGAGGGVSFENLQVGGETAGIRLGIVPVGAFKGPPEIPGQQAPGHHGLCEGIGELPDAAHGCSTTDRMEERLALTTYCYFRNVQITLSNGPVVDVGWSFWDWFERCTFGNTTAPFDIDDTIPLDDDRRAAILFQPKTSPAPGAAGQALSYLIYIRDCRLDGGGNIRIYAYDGLGIEVSNVSSQGAFGVITRPGVRPVRTGLRNYPCPVHIVGINPGGWALVRDVTLSDGQAEAIVKVEDRTGRFIADNVVCMNVNTVIGPATVLNRDVRRLSTTEKMPTVERQVGFWTGRVIGQHDSARRSFGPVAVRFPNQLPYDAVGWRRPGRVAGTVTGDANVRWDTANDRPARLLAPDGTYGAFALTPPADSNPMKPEWSVTFRVNRGPRYGTPEIRNGDFLVAGLWFRRPQPVHPSYYQVAAIALKNQVFRRSDNTTYPLYDIGDGQNQRSFNAPIKGDGEWLWTSMAARIRRNRPDEERFAEDSVVHFTLFYHWDVSEPDLSHRNQYVNEYYAPILLYLSTEETASENEAFEIAQHLSTWPDGAEPGTVTLLPSQTFMVQPKQVFLVQGDLIYRGPPPKASVESASGDADVEVDGSVHAGTLRLKTRNATGLIGPVLSVPLPTISGVRRHVMLTPASGASGANAPGFFTSVFPGHFTIDIVSPVAADTEYAWHYQVVQSTNISLRQ